jgi:energy-coupling factor transporter ATP-binding protein EcfA2
MGPPIQTLTIENFRAIKKLTISGLGRVNLFTGRNNTGKSTVLEAVRLLVSDASLSVLYDILRSREEDVYELEDESKPSVDSDGAFLFSCLFNGFPSFSGQIPPILIKTASGQRPMRLSLGVGLFSEERNTDGTRRLIPQQANLFDGEEGLLPGLLIDADGKSRSLPLDFLRRYPYRRSVRPDSAGESRTFCQYVSPHGGERTTLLGPLWDNIALSDREKDIVSALQIIDSKISAVSMVGGTRPRQTRKAIVRVEGIPRPVPLRAFGDGMNRLFGVALALVNAKGGVLLIDEFENGLHHTVQTDVWRAVFKLARDLDVQVMATSHSWDAIEAFQKAAAEDPEEGVLVRLARKGEGILATVFTENELAVATRDRIEVR